MGHRQLLRSFRCVTQASIRRHGLSEGGDRIAGVAPRDHGHGSREGTGPSLPCGSDTQVEHRRDGNAPGILRLRQ